MATNIQKEALQLFGTPTGGEGLMTFDPESYSKSIGLPGTEDIAGPNPLAAISTAESRTYTPPTRSAEQVSDSAPAFTSDINIAAPSLDDFEGINDVPGFANISPEAINSLGLLGMTPTSLTKTFNNLQNLSVEGIATNAFNSVTQGTAIGGALGIAEKALSGAFTSALSSTTNPTQIAGLITLADRLSNLDINALLDTPNQIEANVEALFTGIANFIDAPLETLEAFTELAGTYAQYGTMSPTLNSFTVNGIEQTYVTNPAGQVVTTPGFVQAIIGMSPLSNMVQAINVLGNLFSDESAEERAGRHMANLDIAQNLPSLQGVVDVPQLGGAINFSITSLPSNLTDIGVAGIEFSDIVSIPAGAVPGLDTSINVDMSEFSRTGTVSGAVIGGVLGSLAGEYELEEALNAALTATQSTPETIASRELADAIGQIGLNVTNQTTLGNLTAAELAETDLMADFSAKDQAIAGVENMLEAMVMGEITNVEELTDYVNVKSSSKLGIDLADQKALTKTFQSLRSLAPAYAERAGHIKSTVVAGISPNAPPSLENFYGAVSENLGRDWNSTGPAGNTSIDVAMAVMSLLGKNTYQPEFNAEDKKATVELLSVMDIHTVNATKAVDIMSQVEQMASMTAEQAAADVAATASAVESFSNMSMADMASMSDAEAASMDEDMGFGEDSDW